MPFSTRIPNLQSPFKTDPGPLERGYVVFATEQILYKLNVTSTGITKS